MLPDPSWVVVANFSTEELGRLSVEELRTLASQEEIDVFDIDRNDPQAHAKLIRRIQRAYE